MTEKAEGAFRTIGELSAELGVAQHILRYWETRFKQLKPLTRAGNRRYYRAEDVVLVKHIHRLLNVEGYTVKGVQKLLSGSAAEQASLPVAAPAVTQASPIAAATVAVPAPDIIVPLRRIRNQLAAALSTA